MAEKQKDEAYRDREQKQKVQIIYGKTLSESLSIFHHQIQLGCIFVCSVCHQTNFEDNVSKVENLHTVVHHQLLQECLTGYKSVDETVFICIPCKTAIYRGQIPKLSIRNKCGFPVKPPELNLCSLEE